MLEILLAVILTAHLLSVDVAMAGPLWCVWIEWRAARRADPSSDALARRLAVLSLGALAVGSVLGCVLLAMRYVADDTAYWAALAAIPRDRIWFGLAELVFSFVCLAMYIALWNRLRGHRVWHRLLAVAGASNTLIHLPAFFTIVSVLSTRGKLAAATLDRAAYRQMLVEGEVMSRVVHVWLAAAAVTGIVVVVLALRTPEPLMSARIRARQLQGAAWLALVATVLQFPTGMWVVLETPDAARQPLLGGDWLATGLFLAALVLGVQLLHLLWAIAVGEGQTRQVRYTVAVVTILVLLMVAMRLRLGERATSETHAMAQPVEYLGGPLARWDSALPLRRAPVAIQ